MPSFCYACKDIRSNQNYTEFQAAYGVFSHTQPREKSLPRDSRDDRDDVFATAAEVVTAVTVVTLEDNLR